MNFMLPLTFQLQNDRDKETKWTAKQLKMLFALFTYSQNFMHNLRFTRIVKIAKTSLIFGRGSSDGKSAGMKNLGLISRHLAQWRRCTCATFYGAACAANMRCCIAVQ